MTISVEVEPPEPTLGKRLSGGQSFAGGTDTPSNLNTSSILGAGLIKNPRKNISATNILAPSPRRSGEMKTIEINKSSETSMSAGSDSVDSDTGKKRKPQF